MSKETVKARKAMKRAAREALPTNQEIKQQKKHSAEVAQQQLEIESQVEPSYRDAYRTVRHFGDWRPLWIRLRPLQHLDNATISNQTNIPIGTIKRCMKIQGFNQFGQYKRENHERS